MFDILMQDKKVYLINESEIGMKSNQDLIIQKRCYDNDPIEAEMLKFNTDNPEYLNTSDINTNRVIIKFLGWNPSLFNNIQVKQMRG